jgi:hypothetical protein
MTNIIEFKPRNSVGVPTWVLRLSNAALLDEFNDLIDEHEGSTRFRFISGEIRRREEEGTLTNTDWAEPPS